MRTRIPWRLGLSIASMASVAVIISCSPSGQPAEPAPEASSADSVEARAVSSADPAYAETITTWQDERETGLKGDESWLTVAGLFWLREGSSSVGSARTNDFVLAEGSAPATVGVFEFADRKATFVAEEGVSVTQAGAPVDSVALEMGEKHALEIGQLKMWLHYSGDRLAIRLRDLDATLRKEFVGLSWFPVDPAFRVNAKFTPHPEPKKVDMLNILGDIETFESPGYVDFELDGETVRMEPLSVREGALWFVYRDGTSGKESYAAARFLRTAPPENGEVVIDFNKSYNPPCAYNPFTTCPMPTEENRLGIRIEAGEKNYKNHS